MIYRLPDQTATGPASVGEDAGTLGDGTPTGDDTAITVTLAPAPVADVTVAWMIAGSGSAPAVAADFGTGAGLRSGTFTFTAGTTDLTRTIAVWRG